jgi:serine phosphatase RsbU (regulator of sigma subunit)
MIRLLADQAGVAIQRYRLQQEALAAQYMRHEMELARRVQQAMIPKSAPEIAGLDAVGWTRAASQTGGDCFDLWKTSDGRLGVFVGDATGHGIAPAIIVSQTRTLVRAMCDVRSDPHDLLECANARLCEDLAPGTFVTAFLAFIAPDGTMHWTSAGHGPLLFRDTQGAELRELEAPAPPLGVVAPFAGDRVEPIRLGAGGLLAVASDGVFDARDPGGTIYDAARVRSLLDAHRAEPAQRALEALRQELVAWQGKEEPIDDQTVVFVRKP